MLNTCIIWYLPVISGGILCFSKIMILEFSLTVYYYLVYKEFKNTKLTRREDCVA